MPAKTQSSSSERFANPWKDMLNADTLSLKEIVTALQWGAPSDRLTPEIKRALAETYRE